MGAIYGSKWAGAKMKTPEEHAKNLMDNFCAQSGLIRNQYIAFDLENKIAQAIQRERSRSQKLKEALGRIERHELNKYLDCPEKREESEVFCIAFDALAEYEGEK